MLSTTSATVKELQELRRGRGLASENILPRVGPRLRLACGISEGETIAGVRRSVTLKLTELCERLDADLRLAARVAFGLHPQANGITLEDRVSWLAARLERDPKTAIRRVDSAFRVLAEMLDDQDNDTNIFAPTGWYNYSVRSVLRMDLPLPQLTEERRIIPTVEPLREITVFLSAQRAHEFDDERQIRAEMVYGGEIIDQDHSSPGYARFTIRLPEALSLGHPHEYGIQFTSYPRERMQPYYEFAPTVPCAHFYLRVKFGEENKPAAIWKLNGVPHFAVSSFAPIGESVKLDSLGEASLEFHGLKQNLSYGLQWRRG